MTSYIQLLKKIEDFCDAHYQIQRYGGEFREQMPNLSTESDKYPIVFVTPTGGTPLYDTNQISLDIYCVDIIQKNRANLNTIVSDCHLILTDLYGYFSQGSDLSVDVIGQPSQTPLNNLDLDYVAGWMMTIVFEVNGYCVEAIPMGDIPSGGGACEDASYVVEYADGTPIESGTIPSGGSVTVVVPNCPTCDVANWTLRDTDGNVLDSGTIASGGSATIIAPDATVNVNGTLWDTVLSGGTENIIVRQSSGSTQVGSIQGQYFRIDDSNIQNSDGSYNVDVKAEDSLVLPDSQINVNGNDEGDVVSVKTIDVNITDGTNPVTPDAVSLSGNILTVQVPAGGAAPVGAKPIKTGQTVSYASEDDGATQRGRLVDFFTLDSNNAFGNTNRFTDLTGGQTYASNGVFLDHSTDNGNEILAFTNSPTNTNWSGSLTSIAAQSTDGKTDWYMPNVQELNLLVNEASNPNLNWTPLTTVATPFTGNIYCWTSTTPISNTARAKAFYSSTAIDGNEMLTLAKTLGVRSLACRYYTYAELGL